MEKKPEGTLWYYLDKDGAQQGPVSEAEAAALAEKGAIGADTYVWKSGMAQWVACKETALLASAEEPAPAKTEKADAAPAKTEKTKPAKAEPAKAEPATTAAHKHRARRQGKLAGVSDAFFTRMGFSERDEDGRRIYNGKLTGVWDTALMFARLVLGILTVAFYFRTIYVHWPRAHSRNTFLRNYELGGWSGTLCGLVFLAAGIVAVLFWRSVSNTATAALIILYGLSTSIGFMLIGNYPNLWLWTAWSATCLVLAIATMMIRRLTW